MHTPLRASQYTTALRRALKAATPAGVLLAGNLLASCAYDTYRGPESLRPIRTQLIPDYLPGPAPETETGESFLHFFGPEHDPSRWIRSNMNYSDSIHPAWLAEQIHFHDDRIELELNRRRVQDKVFAGAEYHRRGFYHYGRYEVVMRAAPGSGTVSAMFTHTHAQFGDPHDEIDIEFLGRDLSMVTFNYFADGSSHGSIYIPLPFDASREIHLYAYEWEPAEIRWYVNDELVHTSTPEDHPIPQAPGRIMMHLWSGTRYQYMWHGEPTFENGTRAAYYCLSFQRAGDETPQCSDSFDPAEANAG